MIIPQATIVDAQLAIVATWHVPHSGIDTRRAKLPSIQHPHSHLIHRLLDPCTTQSPTPFIEGHIGKW